MREVGTLADGYAWLNDAAISEAGCITIVPAISLTGPADHAQIGRRRPDTVDRRADVRVVTTARSAHELPTRPEIQLEAASWISPENRL